MKTTTYTLTLLTAALLLSGRTAWGQEVPAAPVASAETETQQPSEGLEGVTRPRSEPDHDHGKTTGPAGGAGGGSAAPS